CSGPDEDSGTVGPARLLFKRTVAHGADCTSGAIGRGVDAHAERRELPELDLVTGVQFDPVGRSLGRVVGAQGALLLGDLDAVDAGPVETAEAANADRRRVEGNRAMSARYVLGDRFGRHADVALNGPADDAPGRPGEDEFAGHVVPPQKSQLDGTV